MRQQLVMDSLPYCTYMCYATFVLQEIFRSRAAQHLATEHSDSLHLRRHFLAWKSYCRDLKRDQWEKERKALVHNNK